jgi:ferritin-like metal-binding protein YciE
MAANAEEEDLRDAFEHHVSETEMQLERLEEVFDFFDRKAKGMKCESVDGLVKEIEVLQSRYEGSPVLDKALIGAAQKIEHYEMAAYGCLFHWATLLDNEPAAELLREILDQEEAANDTLIDIAEGAPLTAAE